MAVLRASGLVYPAECPGLVSTNTDLLGSVVTVSEFTGLVDVHIVRTRPDNT